MRGRGAALEVLAPATTLTPAASWAEDAIWERVGTAVTMGLGSGPGLCWTEATQAQAGEGVLYTFPGTHFLSPFR